MQDTSLTSSTDRISELRSLKKASPAESLRLAIDVRRIGEAIASQLRPRAARVGPDFSCPNVAK